MRVDFCVVLDKYFKFSAYMYRYMISVDPVIMVPHSPDHQKLQNSEESN